jgi:hypothetical protein
MGGAGAVLGALIAALAAPAAVSASPLDPSGVIKLLKRPHVSLNANQSSNWFGYDQGMLEQGVKLLHSITGDWTVPTATAQGSGKAGSSATWIGIGGGCIDAACTLTDPTGLIQTGTEQDVDSSGHASYSAWWELVPVPAVTITNMAVAPGDHMHADVSELIPGLELWKITLDDVTRGESFTTTVPYPSSHASAEWIQETPLAISLSGAGVASLPTLTATPFDNATVNGAPAALKPSEALNLSNGSQVIGTVSAPDAESDGFGACAWTTSCPLVASSIVQPRRAPSSSTRSHRPKRAHRPNRAHRHRRAKRRH